MHKEQRRPLYMLSIQALPFARLAPHQKDAKVYSQDGKVYRLCNSTHTPLFPKAVVWCIRNLAFFLTKRRYPFDKNTTLDNGSQKITKNQQLIL